MIEKGTCKHGTFDLADGCAQCIAEKKSLSRMNASQLVKVQYFSESTGEISPREYTYYSEDRLEVGDIVSVPIRNTMTKAKVSAVNVPESEVAAFKDKVKTIPAKQPPEVFEPELRGELLVEIRDGEITRQSGGLAAAPAPAPEPELDTKVNLCDTCVLRSEYPVCSPDDVVFGDGKGNDNIIQCGNYQIAPERAEMEAGLNQEGLTLGNGLAAAAQAAGAEVTAVEVEVWKPGEDVEVRGYYADGVRLLDFATCRVIATAEDNKAANMDLGIIAKLRKAMDAKKRENLEPLKEKSDAIRDTYNYLMGPVLEAEKITRAKMGAWDIELRRRRAEQEDINRLKMETARKEAELSGTGEITESVNLVGVTPEPRPVATDVATTSMTAHWTYEVVDFALVPDAYKVIDKAQLSTIARSHHDQKPIPGVRFFNNPSITVRT